MGVDYPATPPCFAVMIEIDGTKEPGNIHTKVLTVVGVVSIVNNCLYCYLYTLHATRGGWSRLIIRSRALYVCTQGPQSNPIICIPFFGCQFCLLRLASVFNF